MTTQNKKIVFNIPKTTKNPNKQYYSFVESQQQQQILNTTQSNQKKSGRSNKQEDIIEEFSNDYSVDIENKLQNMYFQDQLNKKNRNITFKSNNQRPKHQKNNSLNFQKSFYNQQQDLQEFSIQTLYDYIKQQIQIFIDPIKYELSVIQNYYYQLNSQFEDKSQEIEQTFSLQQQTITLILNAVNQFYQKFYSQNSNQTSIQQNSQLQNIQQANKNLMMSTELMFSNSSINESQKYLNNQLNQNFFLPSTNSNSNKKQFNQEEKLLIDQDDSIFSSNCQRIEQNFNQESFDLQLKYSQNSNQQIKSQRMSNNNLFTQQSIEALQQNSFMKDYSLQLEQNNQMLKQMNENIKQDNQLNLIKQSSLNIIQEEENPSIDLIQIKLDSVENENQLRSQTPFSQDGNIQLTTESVDGDNLSNRIQFQSFLNINDTKADLKSLLNENNYYQTTKNIKILDQLSDESISTKNNNIVQNQRNSRQNIYSLYNQNFKQINQKDLNSRLKKKIQFLYQNTEIQQFSNETRQKIKQPNYTQQSFN